MSCLGGSIPDTSDGNVLVSWPVSRVGGWLQAWREMAQPFGGRDDRRFLLTFLVGSSTCERFVLPDPRVAKCVSELCCRREAVLIRTVRPKTEPRTKPEPRISGSYFFVAFEQVVVE